jgi:hypothetical protein
VEDCAIPLPIAPLSGFRLELRVGSWKAIEKQRGQKRFETSSVNDVLFFAFFVLARAVFE